MAGRAAARLTIDGDVNVNNYGLMAASAAQQKARSVRKDSAGPRRAELLGVAAACFDDHGYEHTTVETITSRAQVSRASFYAYFASKEEVFRAVAERVCSRFLDAQLVVDVRAADPIDVVRGTTRAFADAVFANGTLVALIEHRAGVDRVIGELWAQAQARLRGRFTAFLEQAEARGEIDPCVSPRRIVETLSDALMIGAARLSAAGPEQQAAFIADYLTVTEKLIGFNRQNHDGSGKGSL